MRSPMGRMFGIGGAFAILALIVGMVMNPAPARRLGEIAAAAGKRGSPPTPEETAEIARLERRLSLGTILVGILLALAVSAMAIARYI